MPMCLLALRLLIFLMAFVDVNNSSRLVSKARWIGGVVSRYYPSSLGKLKVDSGALLDSRFSGLAVRVTTSISVLLTTGVYV